MSALPDQLTAALMLAQRQPDEVLVYSSGVGTMYYNRHAVGRMNSGIVRNERASLHIASVTAEDCNIGCWICSASARAHP